MFAAEVEGNMGLLLVQTLLEYQADKTVSDLKGDRPVDYASHEAVKELLAIPMEDPLQ